MFFKIKSAFVGEWTLHNPTWKRVVYEKVYLFRHLRMSWRDMERGWEREVNEYGWRNIKWKTSLWRHRHRWKNNVKTDIWNIGLQVEVSIELLKWSAFVNTMMNIYTNKRTPVIYTVISIVNQLHLTKNWHTHTQLYLL